MTPSHDSGQILRIDTLKNPARNTSAAIEYFLGYCRSRNLSDNTVGFYRYRLSAFACYLDESFPGTCPETVSKLMVREYTNCRLRVASPTTVNHDLMSLRALFSLLIDDGLTANNPMVGVKNVKRKRKIIETFVPAQMEQILATCDSTFVGVRDRAIIMLLYDCGLRASELCGLSAEHVDWGGRTVLVTGKGNKERFVPFGESTRRALSVYFARRPELDTDSFFVTCYGTAIGRQRLLAITKERCKQAGITGARCSPHTFRHTFAVNYLRNGGDLFVLQRILGHCDLSMTRRYVEFSETDVQRNHREYSPADRLSCNMPKSGRTRIR